MKEEDDKAEFYYTKSMQLRIKILGEEHEDCLSVMQIWDYSIGMRKKITKKQKNSWSRQ